MNDFKRLGLQLRFMLSNSPGGNMAFENSPFKLTQALGLAGSDCVRGFAISTACQGVVLVFLAHAHFKFAHDQGSSNGGNPGCHGRRVL